MKRFIPALWLLALPALCLGFGFGSGGGGNMTAAEKAKLAGIATGATAVDLTAPGPIGGNTPNTVQTTGVTVPQSGSAQYWDFMGASGSGSGKIRLTVPDAIPADHTWTLGLGTILYDGASFSSGTGNGTAFTTPSAPALLNYSGSGDRMYRTTAYSVGKLPATAGNLHLAIHARYSTALVYGNSSSDYFVDLTDGLTTTAGYYLHLAKGTVIKLWNEAADNIWYVIKEAGTVAQDALAWVASLALNSSSNDFGNVTDATESAHAAFTLTNSGNANATNVTFNGYSAAFRIISSTCGSTLNASSNCAFKYAFAPTAARVYNGHLEITADGLTPLYLAMTGTGITGNLLGWNGLYNAATASPGGQTLTAATLSAGSLDGTYPPSTTIDASGDSMSVGSLTWAAGIASQSGKPVMNINQGTILVRFSVSDNTVASQYVFGKYTLSTAASFSIYYAGNATAGSRRIYVGLSDAQGTQNSISCYRTYNATNGEFHNYSVTWNLASANSLAISIDGDAYSCTSHTGTETNLVVSDFGFTNIYFGSRSTSTAYRGEISDVEISNQYNATLSPQ